MTDWITKWEQMNIKIILGRIYPIISSESAYSNIIITNTKSVLQ